MWDRTLTPNLLHPFIRSFITTLSLQGDNRREIEVHVCAWGSSSSVLPPIPSFAPFLQMVAFPFLPWTRNSSRPKFGVVSSMDVFLWIGNNPGQRLSGS